MKDGENGQVDAAGLNKWADECIKMYQVSIDLLLKKCMNWWLIHWETVTLLIDSLFDWRADLLKGFKTYDL